MELEQTSSSYLSVSTSLHHGHDDVLRGHEGKLVADVSLDDLGVNHQSLCDVLQRGEDDVCCEEGLGQRDPPATSSESLREPRSGNLELTQSQLAARSNVKGTKTKPVSAVVQCPLQPLHRGRLQRVGQQRHQVSSQAAATLRSHGVPLVRHGT